MNPTGSAPFAPRPDLLELLRLAAYRTFGYVDEYEPNNLLHSWVVQRLEALTEGYLVDLGAGVTPLPIVFADRGLRVHTVDGSKLVRTLPADHTWNGWGFFDYSKVNSNVQSYQCLAQDHVPHRNYDSAYSIGMIAHMESASRRSLFEKLQLVAGGRFYFSVSLVQNSDYIWNRREGEEVEPIEKHGRIADIFAELREFKYQVSEQHVLRSVSGSITDFLLVGASR